MPTFATPGPVTATVEVAGAQVRVTASDRTDTVVLVEPRNPASRKDVKVAGQTKVDLAGGQLTVKTTTPGDKSGSVAITIDLPAGSSLAAYLAHSSVQVDGPVGPCELHMASGRVQLDRIEALRANISAGEVEIAHIAGRADIDGGAFAVRIGEAEGPVAITGSGGQREIDPARPAGDQHDLEIGELGVAPDVPEDELARDLDLAGQLARDGHRRPEDGLELRRPLEEAHL